MSVPFPVDHVALVYGDFCNEASLEIFVYRIINNVTRDDFIDSTLYYERVIAFILQIQ